MKQYRVCPIFNGRQTGEYFVIIVWRSPFQHFGTLTLVIRPSLYMTPLFVVKYQNSQKNIEISSSKQ